MNNILKSNEISNYKDIGKKTDEPKVNQVIEQAQLMDLKPLLGDRFYFDVLNNMDNPDYAGLFSGCSFTYSDVQYYQDGLKAILADFFMSRFALQVNANFTPFGSTVKVSADSEPTDRNSLKDVSTQQNQMGLTRWEITYLYLNANPNLFTQWKNNVCGDDSLLAGERTFKFRRI